MDEQLFVLPFAKSAVASLHSPVRSLETAVLLARILRFAGQDNASHAFLQLEDRALVYRGADQPDMSVINPESDVWQHIKIPADYLAANWPVRCSCISSDGRLVAVAGRRGFTHYNSLSGRWKLFNSDSQEQSVTVRGGMHWYGNTLIVATEEKDGFYVSGTQLNLFDPPPASPLFFSLALCSVLML
jgi:RAB6A-GEF complex partner protein 1